MQPLKTGGWMRAGGLFVALSLVGCGNGSGSKTDTEEDTGSALTCTCRDPVATVSVTLDGASAVPDRVVLDGALGADDPVEVCGPAAEPCDAATFELPYLSPRCLVEVDLGQGTMAQACEDNLTGPEPCVCGEDASLTFAFSSATTGPWQEDRKHSRVAASVQTTGRSLMGDGEWIVKHWGGAVHRTCLRGPRLMQGCFRGPTLRPWAHFACSSR